MFPKKLACIFLALLMPFVQASANDLIFKCDVKNHKQISLHTKSGDVIYSFGRIGEKPEFELSRKKQQIETNFENLSGRYATNSIIIRNGNYSYRLTTSIDRIADIQEPSTSLTVMKNDKDLTTLQCIKGSEVGALIAIDD
ncbi:hypothetical protein ACLLS5_002436 [Salmonella enterica]|uniref:Lysozyme inhibitor n=4 Tax=Salmonella enterica TaxID=28901 RepID=A0A2X4TIF4_SALER|nr:hypothetical protein [Salmonella enterica]EAW2115834.1 hypothetical protein [Salmonella enterica subsp. enterica]EBD1258528.1 hypothetical protein [Salmonella enterica subsp. arizonae serovar 62:z4,z32:-]EBH8076111.1 hypothetical protein [Salmonella bongori]EBH9976424.1 hypothetical protein [Salmonella enterica subsp. arizonae serovar 40:z36:-]ECU0368615.1 hypothetical protein [Salmonella enterica subsp. enterica serovar Newport]EDR5868981.1 hypothetical protein [Salmonella enterica subsp.